MLTRSQRAQHIKLHKHPDDDDKLIELDDITTTPKNKSRKRTSSSLTQKNKQKLKEAEDHQKAVELKTLIPKSQDRPLSKEEAEQLRDDKDTQRNLINQSIENDSTNVDDDIHQESHDQTTEAFVVPTHFVPKPLNKIKDEFETVQALADTTFQVRGKNAQQDQVRVMKVFNKETLPDYERIAFFNECQNLQKLHHPNILKLIDFYEDSENYYLITEYIEGKDLLDEIYERDTFLEEEAAQITKQILKALAYAHQHNVVHRDVKPENIIVQSVRGQTEEKKDGDNFPHDFDRCTIKIVDWGLSTKFNKHKDALLTQRCGTFYYAAPEVLKKHYNEKCDVWSAGVILYLLLSGEMPFPGHNKDEVIISIQDGKLNFQSENWTDISPEAIDLIKKMLTQNYEERIGAREALNHEWFKTSEGKKQSSKKLSNKKLEQYRAPKINKTDMIQ